MLQVTSSPLHPVSSVTNTNGRNYFLFCKRFIIFNYVYGCGLCGVMCTRVLVSLEARGIELPGVIGHKLPYTGVGNSVQYSGRAVCAPQCCAISSPLSGFVVVGTELMAPSRLVTNRSSSKLEMPSASITKINP